MESIAVVPGDPDCICGGTGLVCKLGPDLKPDPASIEVCDCVVQQARKWERERVLSGEDRARLELIRDHDGNDLSENDKALLTRLATLTALEDEA